MRRHLAASLLFLLCAFGFPHATNAALYDVSVSAGDISFSPSELILGDATRIYATILNKGERDVEGIARFYDHDTLIGAKAFSVRANTRPEDAWVRWSPSGYGDHTIRVVLDNDPGYVDGNLSDNAAMVTAFVDRDTDGDGVPDRQDDDRDNDGLLNSEEASLGTDPLRADTDGDGVDDKKDVFPLDATKSVTPPPPVATPKPPINAVPKVVQAPQKIVTSPTPARIAPTAQVETASLVTDTAPASVTSPSVDIASSSESFVEPPSPTEPAVVMEPIPAIDSMTEEAQVMDVSRSSWNTFLMIAAGLSATAAAAFVWLGRRS